MSKTSLRDQIADQLSALRRYALALARDRDRAEDLVQETLVRAIAGARTFRPGGNLRRWLFGILHHTHVSDLRRASVRAGSAAEIEALTISDIPPNQPDRIELHRAMEALSRLPGDQRQVLVLVAIDGMSYQEAADILGIPLGTLMSRLARGRDALRADIGRGRTPGLRLVR